MYDSKHAFRHLIWVMSSSSNGTMLSVHVHTMGAVHTMGVMGAESVCRKGAEVLCRQETLVQIQSSKQCPGMMPEFRH